MAVRENRSGRQTKEWILETACQLFNEHGTQSISTKRIAKEMGISPGNLYYHFKNKEEIILALFDANQDSYTGDWDNPQVPPLKRFLKIIHDVVLMWQDCRFFKKEMVFLVENDPELKHAYQEFTQTITEKVGVLFQDLLQAGMIRTQEAPDRFESLLVISTIIANHWLTHLDISDQPLTIENLQKGAELILLVWQPYLTDDALTELERLKEEDRSAN